MDEAIGYEAVRRRDGLLAPIRERSRQALDITRAWMAGQEVSSGWSRKAARWASRASDWGSSPTPAASTRSYSSGMVRAAGPLAK